MMQCEIIRDLLPLYHDGACSAQSRAAVEAHLGGCAACAAQLHEIETPLEVAGLREPRAGALRMRKAKNKLMRRTAFSILPMLVALGVLAAFLSAALERVRPLPYSQVALSAAWNDEDQTLEITIEKPVRFVYAQCSFYRIKIDGAWKDVALLRLEQSWTRKLFDYSKDGPAVKSFDGGANLRLIDAWGQLARPWFDPVYESEFWNPAWAYPGDLAAVYYRDGDSPVSPEVGVPEGWALVWER